MMQAIRDSAKGWIGWVIVVIIIIPFALWGVHEYAERQATVAVATVNGEEITERELQNAYLQQRQRLQSMMGDRFRPDMIDDAQLRREALDQLVERRVLMEAVLDARFRVADEQIAAQVRSFDVFWDNGTFSPQRYRQFLASQNMTPEQFEQQLRGDVLLEQLYAGVSATAFATEHEYQELLRLRDQRRDLGYAAVPAERFVKQVSVSDEEVESYYQANRARFVTPERVRVAYVDLGIEDAARTVDISDDALRAFYEERAQQIGGQERREARHILLGTSEGAEERDQAREQAQALRERLLAGEDFAALAREYSEDPGSAEAGGDLGAFGRGDMVPAFEDATFALDEGELSEPVESEFGIHLIQVTGVERARRPAFEEVREELHDELQRRRAETRFRELGERLANLVYEQPDTLSEAAEQLGLEVQYSEWFASRGADEGIAQYHRVVQAAFSDEVLAQGFNSEPIEIEPQRVVVVRVAEHEPATPLPLAEVRGRIESDLRAQKARAQAAQLAERIVERARAGESPADVAAAEGLEWVRVAQVNRSGEGAEKASVPGSVARVGFSLPRPTEAQVSAGLVEGENGDPVVVGVYAVNEGEPDAAADNARLRQALASSYGNRLFQALVEAIKAQSDIQVHSQEP